MVVALTAVPGRRRRHRRRAAADRAVHRDLRHLRQCRRPRAELPRRRQAARRGASGLEGAARARQPARPRRLRLRVLRGRARRGARRVAPIAGAPRRRRRRLPAARGAGRRRRRGALERIADVPIYATDPLVRRSPPLQLTPMRGRRSSACRRARAPARPVDGDAVRRRAGRRVGRAAGARRPRRWPPTSSACRRPSGHAAARRHVRRADHVDEGLERRSAAIDTLTVPA